MSKAVFNHCYVMELHVYLAAAVVQRTCSFWTSLVSALVAAECSAAAQRPLRPACQQSLMKLRRPVLASKG